MKFSEILKRLTGISTPVFGVSWNPSESERAVAKRVLAKLEDRRVLFNPSTVEVPEHCVQSVVEIRHILSEELGKLENETNIAKSLRAMRAACRKFLYSVGADERIIRFGAHPGHFASWEFIAAVGQLRGVFGIHIAQIAAQHGLGIEGELASIIPGQDKEK